MAFVEKVTAQGSPDFVPVAERIAVFDNDGTLWAEKRLHFTTLDGVRALRNIRSGRRPSRTDPSSPTT